MKINELLAPWKGDSRFTALSARAAALKKQRMSAEAIIATLTAEFGAPVVRATLRAAPQPYTVIGEIGSDIEPAALHQLQKVKNRSAHPALSHPTVLPGAQPALDR